MQKSRSTTHCSLSVCAIFFTICLLFPVSSYAFHLGDLDIRPLVDLKQAFDDNVTFAEENEKQDFVTDLLVGLDIDYEGKTQSLKVIGNIKQQLFAKEPDFNNISEYANLDFQKEFSEYARLQLTNRFTSTDEPRSFADSFGRTSGRYRYYRNRLDLAYTQDISEKFGVTIKYGNDIYKESRENARDSSLNRAGMQADYFLSSATIISLLYDFEERKFSQLETTAFLQNITGGLTRYLTPKLQLHLRAGVTLVKSFNDQNYTEPRLIASLRKEIDETTRGGISFTKQSTLNSYTEDMFDSWRVSVDFGKQLLERLSYAIEAFYGKGEYRSFQIAYKLNGVRASLAYDLSDDIKGNIGYTYAKTDSTLENNDYVRNRLFLGVTMKF